MSCGRASPCEALPPSPQNAERMNNVSNWLETFPIQAAQGDLAILNSTLGSGLSSFNNSPRAGGCVRGASPNTASNSGQSTASSCARCGDTIDANGGTGLDSINAPSLNSSSGECSRQSTRNDNVAENPNSSWLTSGSGTPPSRYGQRLQTPNRQQPPPEPAGQQGITPIMNACFGNSSPESDSSNRLDEIRPPVFNPSPISERQPCAGSEWASSVESSPVSIDQPNIPSFISSSTASGSAASPVVCGRPAIQSRPVTPCSVPGPCSPCTPPQPRPTCGDNFNMNMSRSDGLSGVGAPSLNSSANSGQRGADFNRVYYQTTGQGLGSVGAPSFNSNMSSSMASRPGTPTFNSQPAASPGVCGRPAAQSRPGTPCSVPGPCSPGTPPQQRPVCGDNLSMNMSGSHGISGIGTPSLNSSYNSGQWGADFNRQYYQTTGQGLESVGAPSFNSSMSNGASRPGTPTFYPQPAASPVVCGRPDVQSRPGTPYSVPGPCSPCTPQQRPVCGINFNMSISGGDGISGMGAPSLNSSNNSGQWGANFNKVNYQTTGQGLESVGAPSFNSNMTSSMSSRPVTPMGQNVAAYFSPQAMSSGAGQSVCCSSQPPSCGQSPNMNSQLNYTPPPLNNSWNPPHVSTPIGQNLHMGSPNAVGIFECSAPSLNQSSNSGGCARMPSPILEMGSPNATGINEFNAPNFNSSSSSGGSGGMQMMPPSASGCYRQQIAGNIGSNNNAPCPRNQNLGNNIGLGSPMYNSTAINDPAAQACVDMRAMPSSVCGNPGVQGMAHPMNTSNASSGFQQPRVITPCRDRLDFNINGATGINDITQPSNIHSSSCSNPVCGDNLNLSGGQGMGISQQTPPGFNSFSSNGSCSSNGAPCPRNIGPQGMSNVSNAGGPPGGCDGRRIPSPSSVQCFKNKLFMITRDRCPCPPTDPNFLNCNERTLDALRRATDEFIPEHMSRIRASAGNQSTGQNMQTGPGCGGGCQNMLPVGRQLPALPAPPQLSSGSSGGVGPCLAHALNTIPEPPPCPRGDASENQGSMNCGRCDIPQTNESHEQERESSRFFSPTAGPNADGIGGSKVKTSPNTQTNQPCMDGQGGWKVKAKDE